MGDKVLTEKGLKTLIKDIKDADSGLDGRITTVDGKVSNVATVAEINQLWDAMTVGSLQDTPWSMIKAVAGAGKASQFWNVGDTKTITMKDSSTYTLRLSDMSGSLYPLSDGSGYAKLGFEFVKCYSDPYAMNTTDTNVGSWRDSSMRNTVMPIILGQMPDDLTSIIAQVKIKTGDYANQSSLIETDDKLFLLAVKEVNYSQYSINTENDALAVWQYYQTHSTSADHKKQGPGGSNSIWWLRSPFKTTSEYFNYIAAAGDLFGGGAHYQYYVSPVFCI